MESVYLSRKGSIHMGKGKRKKKGKMENDMDASNKLYVDYIGNKYKQLVTNSLSKQALLLGLIYPMHWEILIRRHCLPSNMFPKKEHEFIAEIYHRTVSSQPGE